MKKNSFFLLLLLLIRIFVRIKQIIIDITLLDMKRLTAVLMLAITVISMAQDKPMLQALISVDFAQVQQAEQSSFPKIAYFNERHSVFIKDVVSATGNNVPVKIVLTGYNPGKDVDIVHYIKDDYEDDDVNDIPPYIYELVYHDLGPDKEFLGAKIKRNLYDKNTGKYTGATIREVRLDDVSAQYLLDLTTGDTKWTDKSRISFSVTKDPKTMHTKFLD